MVSEFTWVVAKKYLVGREALASQKFEFDYFGRSLQQATRHLFISRRKSEFSFQRLGLNA